MHILDQFNVLDIEIDHLKDGHILLKHTVSETRTQIYEKLYQPEIFRLKYV